MRSEERRNNLKGISFTSSLIEQMRARVEESPDGTTRVIMGNQVYEGRWTASGVEIINVYRKDQEGYNS